MIAVIFEVKLNDEHQDAYLSMAETLKQHLSQIEGFISIERFASLTEKGKLLSLSYWRDEMAVTQWRTLEEHRKAQDAGRKSIFQDYRLRVATVIRDYGLHERTSAPGDSKLFHSPMLGDRLD